MSLANPYVVRVSSQKGGVGKTTIAVNLATILRQYDYKVLLVDGDASNPSIGFHLGLEQVNTGYKDVLNGKIDIRSAIVIHNPTGLQVLPGTLSARPFIPTPDSMVRFRSAINKTGYDFVIFDTAPGFIAKEPTSAYDEALLVTIPEMSAVTSSVRLASLYDKVGLKRNLTINMVRNRRYELSVGEIEEMYEGKTVVIPLDDTVPISVAEHIPACLLDPRAPFTRSIRELSRKYTARQEAYVEKAPKRGGILSFLKRLFGSR